MHTEADGGIQFTPKTALLHELAHYLNAQKGQVKKDGRLIMSAGEPVAVEWENMIRNFYQGASLRVY